MSKNILKPWMLPFLLLATTGCDKEDKEALELEAELLMQYNAIEFIVDPGSYEGAMEFTLSFNGQELQEMLSDNGYSMDQLREFQFTKAELSILTPEEQTFDPVDMVAMKLGLSGTGEQTIAMLDPVPDGAREVTLVLNEVNVADLLRNNEASLKLAAQMSGEITEPVLMRADLGGRVVVRL